MAAVSELSGAHARIGVDVSAEEFSRKKQIALAVAGDEQDLVVCPAIRDDSRLAVPIKSPMAMP